MKVFRKQKNVVRHEIDPDEIFLDSENMPGFDIHQFEGRIEKPISVAAIVALSSVCALFFIILLGKAWTLQAREGEKYALMSQDNVVREMVIFPDRGAVLDRNGTKLAWNKVRDTGADFSERNYIDKKGFSHILGYLKYPTKDKRGFYYRQEFEGMDGIERAYDNRLGGKQGLKILEKDALGAIKSESIIKKAVDGENLSLAIDADIQAKMFGYIKELADRVGFTGGAGAIMDVKTGEILALTSYPEYDSRIMSDGGDTETIQGYLTDKKKPFLNRILSGLYTPGSIVKPYVALAALEEEIIDPGKTIYSSGSISIQNPYDPDKKSVFMDWKAHGSVDMRKALAVSSNVYFYEIGGGFEGQPGLGIDRLKKYFSLLGFGRDTEEGFFKGPSGTIPSPSWKEKVFPGDPWRIGDTYFTAIGQYGFQITPLQALKAIAAVANGGLIFHPSILKISGDDGISAEKIPIDAKHWKIVREGMRQGVLSGTGSALNVPFVEAAAKTGTAELGVSKAFVNSWVTGFFPYKEPRFAFVVIMEHGPKANLYGAAYVMREVLDWMHVYAPEYLK